MNDPLSEFDTEIYAFLEAAGVARDAIQLSVPENQFGERATNAAFQLAKSWRHSPRDIAAEMATRFNRDDYVWIAGVEPAGAGFLNFRLRYESFTPYAIAAIREAGTEFGRQPTPAAETIVVEHTSVNPNKEWHIGHVRNMVLGDVVARVMRLTGRDVEVQNYIDDTGVQCAQAVYAFTKFPEPREAGEKFDHWVGRAYVKINAELLAERELRQRLDALEAEDTQEDAQAYEREVLSVQSRLDNVKRLQQGIWDTMHALERGEHHELVNEILAAQLSTAFRLGGTYDMLNWESHLVRAGILTRSIDTLMASPHVYQATQGRYEGALIIETGPDPAPGEERKAEVLVRSNGIPTYVGKDIAYHMWKFDVLPDELRYVSYMEEPDGRTLWSTALEGDDRPWPAPDRVINIIAVDQTQAQDAVKQGLRAGGFTTAADHLVHLGYGLVTTAEGRISGRKGTTASADSVIDQAVQTALERVREKRSHDLSDEDMQSIAEAVGIGAVRYFMIQYNPLRDIVFDVADVVSYDGNTGLYIQYALVRMFAILRRARDEHNITDEDIARANSSLLTHEQERRLVFHLAKYPDLIQTVQRTLAVNLVSEYAFELAGIFSQFYRDCGVLNAEPDVRAARLLLVSTVQDVLANVCAVLGVPVIERL